MLNIIFNLLFRVDFVVVPVFYSSGVCVLFGKCSGFVILRENQKSLHPARRMIRVRYDD